MKKFLFFIVICFLVVIIYSCERNVFTGIVETETHTYTKIFVDSEPQGSMIFVDGKNMGLITPDTVKWLDEGEHTVTLKNEYFVDTSTVVTTKLNSPINVEVNYYNNSAHYGRLDCRTSPTGATIYVSGVKYETSTTNCVVNKLFGGKYNVKFSMKDYRDDSVDVIIYGSRITRIYRTLEDTSKWVIYNSSNSQPMGNNVYSILNDNNNEKWAGTNNGLLKFSNKKWEKSDYINSSLIGKTIKVLGCDKTGNVWIGTDNGLFCYNGSLVLDFSSNLPSMIVNDLAVNNNTMWIATSNGLVKYDGSWTIFQTGNSGISANRITSVTISKTGEIWAGTEGEGICLYYNNKWTTFNMSNMGLSKRIGNTINDIITDGLGNAWVAHKAIPGQTESTTELGGLTKYDGNSWKIIEFSGIAQEQINRLYSDNYGNVWICTKSGLGKYSIDLSYLSSIFTTSNSKLPDALVTDVIMDANQDLWIATSAGGLARIKKGNY